MHKTIESDYFTPIIVQLYITEKNCTLITQNYLLIVYCMYINWLLFCYEIMTQILEKKNVQFYYTCCTNNIKFILLMYLCLNTLLF